MSFTAHMLIILSCLHASVWFFYFYLNLPRHKADSVMHTHTPHEHTSLLEDTPKSALLMNLKEAVLINLKEHPLLIHIPAPIFPSLHQLISHAAGIMGHDDQFLISAAQLTELTATWMMLQVWEAL